MGNVTVLLIITSCLFALKAASLGILEETARFMSCNCDPREKHDDEGCDAGPEGVGEQGKTTDGLVQQEAAEASDDDVSNDIRPHKDHQENKNSESRNEEMDYEDRLHNLKPAQNLSTRRKEKILLKPLTSHLQSSRFICTFFFTFKQQWSLCKQFSV